MKAIVYDRFGGPENLRVQEVPAPAPNEGEILVRVKAASVNGSDWESLTGSPFYARLPGILRPVQKILGSDIAGVVERVGANVQDFQARRRGVRRAAHLPRRFCRIRLRPGAQPGA